MPRTSNGCERYKNEVLLLVLFIFSGTRHWEDVYSSI